MSCVSEIQSNFVPNYKIKIKLLDTFYNLGRKIALKNEKQNKNQILRKKHPITFLEFHRSFKNNNIFLILLDPTKILSTHVFWHKKLLQMCWQRLLQKCL